MMHLQHSQKVTCQKWADLQYPDAHAAAQPQAAGGAVPQKNMMQGQYAQTEYAPQQGGYMDPNQQMATHPQPVVQQEPVAMPTSYFPPEANDET